MLLSANTRKPPLGTLLLLFLALSYAGYFLAQQYYWYPPVLLAKAQEGEVPAFDYEVTTSDLEVNWQEGGDFDPRDKCPPDFFSDGFVLVCKKVADGAYFKFLYHKGKRLLYRVDKDVIGGKASIGLHWVESTRYNARYRIVDGAFKGGKSLKVPNAKGSTRTKNFRYGQAVSKKRVQPGRELFKSTHINPDQCPEWWDIYNFIP